MVSHAGAGGVRPFLKLLEVQALRGAADRELLRRVAAGADEAAFRVVAERHGPMVFGVCARLLGNRHDAEDALQATFLVLARRAGSVRQSESLASWLHGVARRVALRLRRADRRRTAREKAAAAPDAHAPADGPAWAEVRAGLDEELGRLPVAYREVLVLCYLEGLTRDEAGLRLGIDAGAVKGRLERGRRLLGERLTKRGIGLSAGLAGLAVAPPATAALQLARLAADPAAATPRAAALTHEFLKGVAMSKLKLVTAGLVGVLTLAVGVGTAQPPTKEPYAVPKAGFFRIAEDKDTDEAFIRRISRDLRGTDPTPAEVHFFVASKDANKRTVLVDLFVKERIAKADGRTTAAAALEALAEKASHADAIRQYAQALQLARAQEEQARAEEAKAAAAQAAERAAWAERMAKQGYLSPAQAEAELQRARAGRDVALRAAEEQARAAAEKEAAAQRTVAEALLREAARRKEKDDRGPADPNRPTESKKTPPAPAPLNYPSTRPAPVAPPATGSTRPDPTPVPVVTGGSRITVPAPTAPVPPAVAPVPAANVEVLRVRVQLAEVTVREKMLLVRETEERVKTGTANARDLDRVKLEVERAQLQFREAALTLEAAERPAVRSIPTAPRP